MTDVQSRLAATLQEVLGEPDLVVTDELTANDVDAWDSVAHIELIYALEDEFDITFPVDEIARHADVGELRRDIERRLNA